MLKPLKNIVRTILQEFRQKTYFRQVLMSYIVVSCFTFLIFSVLLLSKIQQENDRTILGFAQQNIEQARAFNESALHDISNFAYQMLDEPYTYRLLYGGSYDTATSIVTRDTYSRIQYSSSMIISLDFINFTTNSVLTKTNRMSLDDYYDTDLLAYIETLEPSRSPVFYQPRESYYNGSHTKPARVLSLIFYTNRRGALVINLDYDAYASQINLARNSENMDLMILNNNSYVMAASDDSYFMQDFSGHPLYAEVMAQSDDAGSFTWNSDIGTQTVLYQRNAMMGMTYLSLVSPHTAYSGSHLFVLTLYYSFVYILVTFFLSLSSSTILYRPVRRLKRSSIRIQKALPDAKNTVKGDFDLIESVFQKLMQEYTSLKQAHGSFKNQKEQKLLHLLLEQPYVASLPKNDDLTALENSFAYENYMVFIINMTIPAESGIEPDIPLVKFMVENVAAELMGEAAAIRGIETVTQRVLFLANFSRSDALQKESFAAAIRSMQELFRQRGNFEIAAGFGCTADSLDTICTSYETARSALDTGMLHAADCICFYSDMELPAPDSQDYPFAIANEITNAVKTADASALEQHLNSFFDAIGGYEYRMIRRHLMHLDDALQQLEHTNHLEILSAPLYAENDLDGSPKLLSEYRAQFQSRCGYDLAALSEIKQHSRAKNDLIVQVQRLVADNIYNANLSVIMLAGQVGLSVNYLRNIYKENTGESLSAYITHCKLEMIYHLLSSTDDSIQEISDKLGFTTKNYFFTFFKKHTGMTPNEYRNQHKA